MNVFITGAAGFIGGSIATGLVKVGHNVTGLVRSTEQAAEMTALGITPVIGTLDDSALLIEQAKKADAVINAASSDHRGAVETLLAALRGSNKTFLHTSGSSIVGDASAVNPAMSSTLKTTCRRRLSTRLLAWPSTT